MTHHHRLILALLTSAAVAVPVSAPVDALAEAQQPGSPPALRAVSPNFGRTVFEDHFDRLQVGPGLTWGWQSTAYSRCSDNTANPDAWKLDRLTRESLSTERGYLTITATPRPDGAWNTGLITTGDSCDTGGTGVQVRTGDLLLAHILLPGGTNGAWPGLWTWRDGKNELDVFEWHSDQPDTVEFVNHVRDGNKAVYYSDPDLIGRERWFYIATRFGADDTVWYLGDRPDRLRQVGHDGLGVGPDFAAYVILNLSVDNGHWHQAPSSTTPMVLGTDLLLIRRPYDRPTG